MFFVQLDEMRGATSDDDSPLMEEEVATLREEFEKEKKQEEVKKVEGEVAVREHLVTNLQLSLTDLQSQLEESHLMLGRANDRLEEREARLEEVEADLEKQVALEALNTELKQLVDKEEKKVAVEEVRKGYFSLPIFYSNFSGSSKAGRGEDARRAGGEEDFARRKSSSCGRGRYFEDQNFLSWISF